MVIPVADVTVTFIFCCHFCFGCEFPSFLQQIVSDDETGSALHTTLFINRKLGDWRVVVKEQNTEHDLDMSVNENKMYFRSAHGGNILKTIICLRCYGNDKYMALQKEQEGGGRGKGLKSSYLCLQFVQRSSDVLQMKKSHSSITMNSTLCDDDSVHSFDPWLLLNAATDDSKGHPCMLTGGFSVRIFDRGSKHRLCDGFRGEIRMENDCIRGDGTYFYFRHQSCVPDLLFMYVNQRLLCLASWSDGPNSFTVLRHDRFKYMWLLRFPSLIEDTFTAYLFMDLIISDPTVSGHSSPVKNYFRLDVVRDIPRPVTSICVDDDDVCSVWRDPCRSGPEMSLRCPRTCNVCNATRPIVCSFETNLTGDWMTGDLDRMSVVIDKMSIKVTSGDHVMETFYCIRWDIPTKNVVNRFLMEKLLVSDFSNGCRPRYTCARILRKSTSVMFFKLSQSMTWPLTSSTSEPIDCRGFTFAENDPEDDYHIRRKYFRLLYAKTKHEAVDCHLPNETKTYRVIFKDKTECFASLAETETRKRFHLSLTGCPTNKTDAFYECLEASWLLPPNELLVITGNVIPLVHYSRDIYCWIFLGSPLRIIYLLDSSRCNEVTKREIQEERLLPLAAFYTIKRLSHDIFRIVPSNDPIRVLSPSVVLDDNHRVYNHWVSNATLNKEEHHFPFAPPSVPNLFILALVGFLFAFLQCIYFCNLS